MADTKEQPKKEKILDISSFTSVISLNIASVMQDRNNLDVMHRAFDNYISSLTDEEKKSKKQEMLEQLTNGRLVMEDLTNRLKLTIGG